MMELRKAIQILSRYSVYWPRFKNGTSKIHVGSVITGASAASAAAVDDEDDDRKRGRLIKAQKFVQKDA